MTQNFERAIPQAVLYPIGHQLGVFRTVEIEKEDRELVASESGDDVLRTDEHGKPLGNHDQELVSRSMSEGVVDELESVEVDEEDRESVIGLEPEPLEESAKPIQEEGPIRELGEAVVESRVLNSLLDVKPFGDVVENGLMSGSFTRSLLLQEGEQTGDLPTVPLQEPGLHVPDGILSCSQPLAKLREAVRVGVEESGRRAQELVPAVPQELSHSWVGVEDAA